MDLSIQQMNEKDLPAVLSLYAQLGQDDGSVLPEEDARTIFARIGSYPDYNVYVAFAGGKTVGTFSLLIMDNLAHLGARSAILEDVVVAEGFRGRGIGKKMIDHAYRISGQKGCYKMVLSSNINRKEAHAFYKKLGFAQHGISFLLPLSHDSRRYDAHP